VSGPYVPEFLAGTIASIRLRRRAGEWDVVSATDGGVRNGDAAMGAFRLAFPWVTVAASEALGEGIEAELDLELSWQAADGTVGRSSLPGAGQFIFDPSEALSTVTVWPNLFTDEIYLYRKAEDGYDRRLVPFERAAVANRDALRRALVAWETLTGGVLSHAESELVDGIERYGFARDARPR
jgi:hypothetical protein